MAYKKPNINIYNDVVGHEVYKALTADLSDEQLENINRTLAEFTKMLETGLIKPCLGMAEEARDEVAADMVKDATERAKKDAIAHDKLGTEQSEG